MAAKSEAQVELSLIDRITAPIRRIAARFKAFGDGLGVNRIATKFGNLGKSIGNVAKQATLLSAGLAAVAAFGVGSTLGQIVTVNAQFEKFGATLETVLGSSDEADKALAWISDFAAKTPYELSEVTESFVKLSAYGIDPVSGSLEAAGDAAAAMGKPIEQAVEAIADAMTGENERLKEFGIRAKVEGDKLVYMWTENGKQMTASADKNSGAQIEATIKGIWNSRYGGAMNKLSTTWDGMVSNLQDQWSRFLLLIGESGAFDVLKGYIEDLLAKINEWAASGKLDEIAKTISDGLVAAMTAIEEAFAKVDWAAVWEEVQHGAEVIGQLAGMFLDLSQHVGGPVVAGLGALALIITGPLIAALAALVPAVVSLGVALLTTPVGWVIAGIAAVAAAVYLLVENWDAVVAAWTAGWDYIVGLGEGIASQIVQWFTVDLGNIAMAMLNGYLESNRRVWGTIAAWGMGLAAEVASWFGIDLYAVGEAIIASLLAGLQSAWAGVTGWFSEQISGLANMIPDWAKGAFGIEVQGKVLSEEEIATKGREAGERAASMYQPAFFGLGESDEDRTKRESAARDAFAAAEAAEIARLKAENAALQAQTAPDMSVQAPNLGGPVEATTVEAGTVQATEFNVPEPIIANQPQHVDASVSVGTIQVDVRGMTPEEAQAMVSGAIRKAGAERQADTLSALND